MKSKFKKADLILLGCVLAVGMILGIVLFFTRSAGAQVQIRVDGKVIKTFPLSVDHAYTIEGADGGINKLIISDGTACISEADCPDGLCVNMGKIHYNGESIICLPHKTVVEVIGGENQTSADPNEDLPDVIVGGRQG